MRFHLAPTSALTDAQGHNEQGRPVSWAATGATHGEHSQKPIAADGGNTAPTLTSTDSGQRIPQKLAGSIVAPFTLAEQDTGPRMNVRFFITLQPLRQHFARRSLRNQ
jgi:hypothetical protein